MSVELIQELEDTFFRVEGPGDRYFALFDERREPIEGEDAARRLEQNAALVVLELEYRGPDGPPRLVGAPSTVRGQDELRRVLRRQGLEALPDARNPGLRMVAPRVGDGGAPARPMPWHPSAFGKGGPAGQ
jgi:hypothetical protein